MKIVSFNINGIRASYKRGLSEWLASGGIDVFCLQETRASEAQVKEMLQTVSGYNSFINSAEKAGYSGTAVLAKKELGEPVVLSLKLPLAGEGRMVALEFASFILLNCYVPHGGLRLETKLEFLESLQQQIMVLQQKKKPIFLATDFNIAHTEKDVSHPQIAKNLTGFLEAERKVVDSYLEQGLLDAYRLKNPTAQAYTWSSYRSKTVANYKGWNYRFDYVFVSKEIKDKIMVSQILYDKFYSDHYPVFVELEEF